MAVHEKQRPRTESSGDFWQGLSFEELARLQRVQPLERLESLLGGWPAEEVADPFEVELAGWRQQGSPDRDRE
jgi:hypothetical protein